MYRLKIEKDMSREWQREWIFTKNWSNYDVSKRGERNCIGKSLHKTWCNPSTSFFFFFFFLISNKNKNFVAGNKLVHGNKYATLLSIHTEKEINKSMRTKFSSIWTNPFLSNYYYYYYYYLISNKFYWKTKYTRCILGEYTSNLKKNKNLRIQAN